MKRLAYVMVAGLLVGGIGCSGPTTNVKGPGGKELSLTAPGDTTVRQGNTAKITVKVDRDRFNDEIRLNFSQLPEGVSVQEDNRTIEKGAREATFTLKADDKAPLKEGHRAQVSASAGDMKAGPLEFTINVKENK